MLRFLAYPCLLGRRCLPRALVEASSDCIIPPEARARANARAHGKAHSCVATQMLPCQWRIIP
eukprot:5650980-Pyramimonas_sp.AAC.1